MSSGLSNSDLAAKAEALHNAGDHDAALDCLHRIQNNIADKQDPRLLHNLRLVENAQKVAKGFNDIQPLHDGLLAIKQQLRAKHERDNNSPDPGTADDLSDAEENIDALLSDADTSILLYNLAALHFQRKEYAASRSILEKLFAHIEPIDEAVAVHICFLLLDVLLHMHRGSLLSDRDRGTFAHSADQVLTHLSKVHMTSNSNVDGSNDEANGGQGGMSNEDKNEKTDATPEQVEYEFRLRLYRAKVSLLQHQLKLSKKEIKSALEVYQRDLRGQGLENDLESLRQGRDLLDPSVSRIGMRNTTAIYLKANFEYLRQNYRKALKLLASSHGGNVGDPSDTTASLNISKQNPGHTAKPAGPVGCMYYNNVGCVHHKMRRHHVALYYFQKALALATNGNSKVLHADGRVMPTLDCEIRYNLALQLLITGRPREAFTRFQEAAALFYKRPNLWLRMAECCMQHHASSQSDESGSNLDSESNGGVVATMVGDGQQRRLLLPCSRPDSCDGSAKQAAASPADALNGSCTMLYASTCLHNVVYLCTAATLLTESRKEEGKAIFGAAVQPTSKESKRKDTSTDSGYDAEPASEIARALAADDSPVLQAAYLDLAYVHLTLADPVIALSYLGKLLALPSLAAASKFLGHMYTAEALCLLGKPNEALDHVAPTEVPKNALNLGSSNNFSGGSGSSSWQINNPQSSGSSASEAVSTTDPSSANDLAALHVNMATVYALQGQLHLADKATRKAVEVCPWSWAAARMLVYILLRTGSTQEALKTLKLSRLNSMAAGNQQPS